MNGFAKLAASSVTDFSFEKSICFSKHSVYTSTTIA